MDSFRENDTLYDGSSEQAKRARNPEDPIVEPPSQYGGPMRGLPQQPYFDPLRVGGSDLDPLGRIGGGGMMVDPQGIGRGGRGFEPQFDPVFPGMPNPGLGGIGMIPPRGRGGRGGRNYGDEMPPPGFDNMFM
jgi:hypothetical protein